MERSKVKSDSENGFTCGTWTAPPGQVWPNYVHDTDELVMLAQGQIELSFSGKTFCPNIGEAILIPALQPHTVRNIGQTTNRWYYGYKKKSH